MIARDVVWFMVRFVVEQQLRTSYGALGAVLLGLVCLLLITSPEATKKTNKEKPAEETKRRNGPGMWWVILLLCLLMAHVQL